jgi:pilus assembly protein CpaF
LIRSPEALDMIQAMSTGHDGSMSTIHANGPEEALWRLESLAATADSGASVDTLRRQIRSAVDCVVFVTRQRGARVVTSVCEVGPDAVVEVYSC